MVFVMSCPDWRLYSQISTTILA